MTVPRDVQCYIDDLGLRPAGPNESEREVRDRVALILRNRGRIIEAHEVNSGARWDDPARGEAVRAGIAGALYGALHDRPVPATPGELDTEVPTGYLATSPPDPTEAALRDAIDVLGEKAAFDLIFGPDDRA